MPSPIISKNVASANREAYEQYVTRFMAILANIKPGEHGEKGLTIKVKDGKIMGAEEINRRTYLVPRGKN